MALDAVFLSGIVSELAPIITGGRIEKINQPERDEIVFAIHNGAENMRLLINAGAGNGRIQLTQRSFVNPSQPPMFCMLLRKYLSGARIERIYQPDWERLVMVDIISRSELGDSVDLKLAVELMGRSSNLVLIGTDGRIIDCLRRMDYGGDAERRMLPGMLYRLPPKQTKPLVFDCDEESAAQILKKTDEGKPLEKRLMDAFSGLSPAVCRELAARCRENADNLPEAVCALTETAKNGELTPTMLMRDGKPESFSFMHMEQYSSEFEQVEYESFCELLDAYYAKKELVLSRQRRSKELSHSVKTATARLDRKLINQREELKRTEDRDKIRKNAELITANMYRIRKGESSVTVSDYYTDGSPETVIELDPLKTPQQNAAAMFKEYNKLKTAQTYLTKLISEGEDRLDYLLSVSSQIEQAETEDDLSEIRRELVKTGFIKPQKNAKQKKQPSPAFRRFVSSDGFEILVGRSNAGNDELTASLARRTDIWLHTKSVHGSHVVIRCDGTEPPEKTIYEASCIAAYYSQAETGTKVAVDYTMIRNVRKPSGSLPGKVIYTDYKTVMAVASDEIIEKLKR